MYKTLTASLLALLTVSCLTGCNQGQKRVQLKLKWNVGEDLEYVQESRRTGQVLEDDTLVSEINSFTMMNTVYKATESIGDTLYKLLQSSTWETANVDGSDTTPPMLFEREVLYTTRMDGKILNAEIKVGAQDSVVEDYMANFSEQSIPTFPSYELAVGESWTQTTTLILPDDDIEASSIFRLTAFVREMGYECAVIEYTGNMYLPIENYSYEGRIYSGVNKVAASGTLYFAYKEGRYIRQHDVWKTVGDRHTSDDGEYREFSVHRTDDVMFRLVKVTP